ncbi:hypothetical protein ACQP2T_60570 [Nonomuraea sp. CA-143628]|uniref:hypothetical protein n=1 Tax=Nonomuraea sp. CA-143628 TaxID=3239997 RepID=UPI003D8ACEE7
MFAAIRRDARQGMSGRELARKYRVSRRTVAQALTSAWPTPRKPLPPRASRLDPYKPLIDQMLRVDLDAPRKQRHTVVRIWNRLVEEHSAVEVSYAMVRNYVRPRRAEIRLEAGRGPSAAFIEQTHQPGNEAEVDFGDVWIRLGDPPAPVPEPFATLLLDYARTRPNTLTATNPDSRWLFPGRRAGQPINPATIHDRLRAHGFQAGKVRTAAIRQLVLQAPAPVVARMLGYNNESAAQIAAQAAGPWSLYAPGDHQR